MKQLEKEIWGQLTEAQFHQKLTELGASLGQPKTVRRLALQITDYNRKDLDTRIRIDQNRVRLMQKMGDWNASVREELELDLSISTADEVCVLWKLLENLLIGDNVKKTLMQLENQVFDTDDFEIKLTHQSGVRDAYSFEIEAKDINSDPITIGKLYGLEPDLSVKDDKYWQEFNEKTNLDINVLSEQDLKNIIGQYVGFNRSVE